MVRMLVVLSVSHAYVLQHMAMTWPMAGACARAAALDSALNTLLRGTA